MRSMVVGHVRDRAPSTGSLTPNVPHHPAACGVAVPLPVPGRIT
ncbi:MAG: hypothetical protein JWQ16_504 [Novosphingobium sp.]|nr:hypothetical protein [Novosphingobium sp.]